MHNRFLIFVTTCLLAAIGALPVAAEAIGPTKVARDVEFGPVIAGSSVIYARQKYAGDARGLQVFYSDLVNPPQTILDTPVDKRGHGIALAGSSHAVVVDFTAFDFVDGDGETPGESSLAFARSSRRNRLDSYPPVKPAAVRACSVWRRTRRPRCACCARCRRRPLML